MPGYVCNSNLIYDLRLQRTINQNRQQQSRAEPKTDQNSTERLNSILKKKRAHIHALIKWVILDYEVLAE
jgi:hypothetical protein